MIKGVTVNMLQEFCASQPEMDKVVNTTMEEFSVSRREGKPMECKSEREDTISESYHVAGVLSVTKLERRADQHPEGPEEERKEQGGSRWQNGGRKSHLWLYRLLPRIAGGVRLTRSVCWRRRWRW